jgi:hypothetical protein
MPISQCVNWGRVRKTENCSQVVNKEAKTSSYTFCPDDDDDLLNTYNIHH